MTYLEAAQAAQLTAQAGLGALAHRSRAVTRLPGVTISGNLDLDDAFRSSEPQANRWDYGVGYIFKREHLAVWIEVHGATSAGEVKTMTRKLIWLKTMLARNEFRALSTLTERNDRHGFRRYWWIAPGKIGFRRGSREERVLAQAGLNFPCREVTLGRE